MGEVRERMKGYEYSMYLELRVIHKLLEKTALDSRLSGIRNGKHHMNLARSLVGKAIEMIKSTVPEDQLDKLEKSEPYLKFYCGVQVPPKGALNRQLGAFLNFEELAELTERAHESCLGCMLERHQAKQCALRRLYDDLDLDLTGQRNRSGFDRDCPYRGV